MRDMQEGLLGLNPRSNNKNRMDSSQFRTLVFLGNWANLKLASPWMQTLATLPQVRRIPSLLQKAGQENHDENIANRPLQAKPWFVKPAFTSLSKPCFRIDSVRKESLVHSNSFSVKVNLEVSQMMNRAPFGPQFGTKQ